MRRIRTLALALMAGCMAASAPALADPGSGRLETIARDNHLFGLALRDYLRRKVAEEQGYPRFGSARERGWHDGGPRVIEGRIRPIEPGPKAGRGYKKHPLPAQCLRRLETRGKDRHIFLKRCLNRSYRFADKLPEGCEIRVRTPRGGRTVYGARCLERHGWRVARR